MTYKFKSAKMVRNSIFILSLLLTFSCKSVDEISTEESISGLTGIAYGIANIPVEEAYRNFKASLEQNRKISIVAEFEHSKSAGSKESSLPPTRIIFFGNPNLGTPLLQKNQLAGLDLPQRVLFFEKDDQVVVI